MRALECIASGRIITEIIFVATIGTVSFTVAESFERHAVRRVAASRVVPRALHGLIAGSRIFVRGVGLDVHEPAVVIAIAHPARRYALVS